MRRTDLEKWEELTQKKWEGLARKMRRTDPPQKWEGLAWKMRRSELEQWEGLTENMGRSDSKNEKDWLGKGLNPKNGKVLLRQVGRTDWKSQKD